MATFNRVPSGIEGLDGVLDSAALECGTDLVSDRTLVAFA